MFIKSLFWQFINSIIKILLEVFVFDRKIRRILKGNWAKFYLRKYVNKGIKNSNKIHTEQKKECQTPIIWQYWESPNGEIPPLVQACLNSVERYKGLYERKILTYNDLKNYIDLPEYIYKLKENGQMNLAHFVDIVRTALLITYGGVWIDATVLLTNPLPDFVEENLFFFQNDIKIDLDGLCGTNYFISAKPNNKILKETLSTMLNYWKENKFLINYFTHMHIITMICKKNLEIFKNIPFISFYPVQQLQNELLNPYNEKRWKQIKNTTSIHKLTHKKSVLTKKKELNIRGTFYEHIIEEYK